MRWIIVLGAALLMQPLAINAQSLPLARLSLTPAPIMESDARSSLLHWTDGETDVTLDVSSLGDQPIDIYEATCAGCAPSVAAASFGSSAVHGGKRVNNIGFTGCPRFACPYLGAIPHGGTLTCLTSYSQYARCDVWNFRNQTDIVLKAGEAGHSYQSPTTSPNCYGDWNIAHGNPGNSLTVFTGLPQRFTIFHVRGGFVGSTIPNQGYFHGVGWNGSLVPSGLWGQLASDASKPLGTLQTPFFITDYIIGSGTATALECMQAPVGMSGFGGAFLNERSFLLTVTYRG